MISHFRGRAIQPVSKEQWTWGASERLPRPAPWEAELTSRVLKGFSPVSIMFPPVSPLFFCVKDPPLPCCPLFFIFNYIKGQEEIKTGFRKLCCPDNDPFFVKIPKCEIPKRTNSASHLLFPFLLLFMLLSVSLTHSSSNTPYQL